MSVPAEQVDKIIRRHARIPCPFACEGSMPMHVMDLLGKDACWWCGRPVIEGHYRFYLEHGHYKDESVSCAQCDAPPSPPPEAFWDTSADPETLILYHDPES